MIYKKSCTKSIGALTHTCDPCDTPELGRVRSLILIKKGTSLNITTLNIQEWRAGIEAGTIIVIPKTIGSFDGGTPKTGDGYGDETERVLSNDYVLSIKDPNYADNVEFWEAAEGETWNVAWRSETLLHYVDKDCKLTAKAPIEEGLDSRVVWNVEIKWNSRTKPQVVPFEPIAEIFDCFEVKSSSSSASASASASQSQAEAQ